MPRPTVPDVTRACRRTAATACAVLLAAAWPLIAAELRPEAAAAFDAYRDRAHAAFLARPALDWSTAPSHSGVLQAGPGEGDGISSVPGGLVHHWRGVAFADGAALPDVVAQSQRYGEYPRIYEAVKSTRLLERRDDTFVTLTRLETGAGGVHGVLEVRSATRYTSPRPGVVLAVSASEEIREVKNAGKPDERLLPEGDDSGYLWRAATFTRYTQVDGGVVIEMETLGLSRRFPRFTGWLIEPFVRRLGRRSVEGSLREFVRAVGRASHAGAVREVGAAPGASQRGANGGWRRIHSSQALDLSTALVHFR